MSTPSAGRRIASGSRPPPAVAAIAETPAVIRRLAPSPGGFAHASGLSVTWPVSSNSRNTRATASALAAKATTMPVITIACGTGSACNPAAAPFRATMPNTRKTPLPIRLNARILRSG